MTWYSSCHLRRAKNHVILIGPLQSLLWHYVLSYNLSIVLIVVLFIRLKGALHNMGISSLFPVQVAVWQETIGPGAFERDLCVNSPTGSGKTLAYALPIVQVLSTRAVRCLRALVVLPTRDLALQVRDLLLFL